jgi:8-oxo-dGTP pyrophosphatase MutT (NUDIX family)
MALVKSIGDGVLRAGATAAHFVLRAAWFLSRPKTYGSHAFAVTPEGKLILVRLRYAPGWRLPGGGRSESEDSAEAALRELREEIGMIAHGDVRVACDVEEPTNFKRDTASLVIVRDVRYRPHRWSWEVERICEANPKSLPPGMAAVSERWIKAVLPLL